MSLPGIILLLSNADASTFRSSIEVPIWSYPGAVRLFQDGMSLDASGLFGRPADILSDVDRSKTIQR